VAHLSLEEAMQLLEVQTIPGEPRQLVRFRNWIERLVESHGETFVSSNRHYLLNQWEEFSKVTFKNCV
jgi:glutamate synthase domain-containing protein 3